MLLFLIYAAILPQPIITLPEAQPAQGPLQKPTFSLLLSYEEAINLVNKGTCTILLTCMLILLILIFDPGVTMVQQQQRQMLLVLQQQQQQFEQQQQHQQQQLQQQQPSE